MYSYPSPAEILCSVSMESGLEGRNNYDEQLSDHSVRLHVSMESGLEGRNNCVVCGFPARGRRVSMESGLEGRNNANPPTMTNTASKVSMDSGLEGRNNALITRRPSTGTSSLNGVRPRRPEQCLHRRHPPVTHPLVSMESGLEGRNNSGSGPRASAMRFASQWSPA